MAALACTPARAQDVPIPSFLDRSLGKVFSLDEDDSHTYASPSANELVPDARDVGLTPLRGLDRLEPIALPKRPSEVTPPTLDLPGLPAYAPQNLPDPDSLRAPRVLTLQATLDKGGKIIPNGLVWRLFSDIPSLDGRLKLIASSESNVARFDVPIGSYLLHVSFGRAGIAKRIEFNGPATQETVVLNAGGLKLNAATADQQEADRSRLRFDVYDLQEDGQDELIASNVPPDEVLRLNAGDYRVVSRYGTVNATVSAEITVEPGQLTEATLRHDAALLTMKLVREHGGEAIADTAWTVTTISGDIVRESVGAFPSMVLAAGDYVISAKNRQKVYQRAFEVKPGEDTDVEVLLSDIVQGEELSELNEPAEASTIAVEAR